MNILKSFDELMATDKSDTLTVRQKLSQWKYFISYPRNTAQVDTAKAKVNSLEQLVKNYAIILHEDNFLTTHEVIPPMFVDTACSFGIGKIYMWARVNAPKQESLTVTWYSERQPIFTDSIKVEMNTVPDYKIWNLQSFDQRFIGKRNEVRLYNENRDLIGRKVFEIML